MFRLLPLIDYNKSSQYPSGAVTDDETGILSFLCREPIKSTSPIMLMENYKGNLDNCQHVSIIVSLLLWFTKVGEMEREDFPIAHK